MPNQTANGLSVASTALSSAVPIAGAALGVLQAGYGIYQDIKSKKKINSLLSQRKAFQTPQQIYDIVNATLSQAQGDTITRDFETNEIDQGLSNTLGAATRLGANPNDLSSFFQQSILGKMKVGQEFHASNTAAFSNVINSFKLLADNKDAEYASQQDILKDKLAAAGVNLQTANSNISGGINTTLGSLSSLGLTNLFKINQPQTQAGITGQPDLSQMLNDLLLANKTNNTLAGNVTDADMLGSMNPNPNFSTTG